jgi:hypothetical protein
MIPGPPIIISCPHCGRYAKKQTLVSANTFGAKIWSDGKRIAPNLPESPSLVQCKKCDQFYWVKDAKEVGVSNNYRELDDKWGNVDYVKFPTFYQYIKALETIPDEKYIRLNILWSYNNYIRNGHEKEITPDMQKLNNENLILLLTLLNESDENDIFMKAEVLRNLSRFEESKQLLDKAKDPDLIQVKEKFLAQIKKKNSRVFRLF